MYTPIAITITITTTPTASTTPTPVPASHYWESADVYDPLEFDAPLSERGVRQARELGALLKRGPDTAAGSAASKPFLPDLRSASVIIVSPLTRAIQTAALVFEGTSVYEYARVCECVHVCSNLLFDSTLLLPVPLY